MTEEISQKAVDYGHKLSPINTGIIFFGGEPLLRKDLIVSTIAYCNELKTRSGFQNHFKLTTNGLLLDESFLVYCKKVKLSIALSIDGIKEAHDFHRSSVSGAGSFGVLEPKIDLILGYQPYASFLMTVSPETVEHYYDSVKYLFNKGVRYIIASLNYAGKWTDASLQELKRQFLQLATLYEDMTIDQKKFYFSPFEVKLSSHIKNEEGMCEKCHLGMRQVSVSVDGSIYPCVQFVNKPEYKMGDVWTGIDGMKRKQLYELSSDIPLCKDCRIQKRCNNGCSCLNIQTTGMINKVSPVLCETERMLTSITDKLGERLFNKKAPMFIQKHYNAVYPILSLVEDTV